MLHLPLFMVRIRDPMNHEPFSSPEEFDRFVEVCRRFEEDLRNGLRPNIDGELAKWPEPLRPHVLNELSDLEQHHRRKRDEMPQADHYATTGPTEPIEPMASTVPLGQPDKIGRYRVVQVLGEGSFGRVYLAHDDDLDRAVAIKVPLAKRVSRPADAEAYLAEARTLAVAQPSAHRLGLRRRPHRGRLVLRRLEVHRGDRPGPAAAGVAAELRRTSARLVATVAEALHHAHRHGLVHRDVKPANILIDKAGAPILADFGLALKDVDFGKGGGLAGTPAYMSPGAGQGRRASRRRPLRHLQPRRRLLRAADEEAAVPVRQSGRVAGADRQR